MKAPRILVPFAAAALLVCITGCEKKDASVQDQAKSMADEASAAVKKETAPVQETATKVVSDTAEQAKQVPEQAKQVPEQAKQVPEQAKQAPDSAMQAPDSAMQAPDSAMQAPKSAMQAPKSAKQVPEPMKEIPTPPSTKAQEIIVSARSLESEGNYQDALGKLKELVSSGEKLSPDQQSVVNAIKAHINDALGSATPTATDAAGAASNLLKK